MTIQIFSHPLLTAPDPTPLKGTLLDAATITEGTTFMDTEAIFESYNCLTTDTLAVDPCPVNVLAAPVQTAATTATTGGTLAAGTYRAVLTGINARGETVISNEISRVTTGATSTITWNWNALTGVTGYRLYVTAVNGAALSETFLIQLGVVTTYVWTGTPAVGTATYPSLNTAVVTVTKTFDTADWIDGFRFSVYAGVICKSVGFDRARGNSELERVFTAKESVAVARALMVNRFVASSGNWAAPTDLTPAAGAVDPSVGLAILEGNAASNYAGNPTIHTPRTIATLLTKTGMIGFKGNILYSQMGSKVAADGGYESPNTGPTGAAPSAGEQWIYGTGEVALGRTAPVFQEWSLNQTTNEVSILRERMYVAAVDCYAAAVRVKVQ